MPTYINSSRDSEEDSEKIVAWLGYNLNQLDVLGHGNLRIPVGQKKSNRTIEQSQTKSTTHADSEVLENSGS